MYDIYDPSLAAGLATFFTTWCFFNFIYFLVSMVFHNINFHLISAVFSLQANMFDFFWMQLYCIAFSLTIKEHHAQNHNKHRSDHVKEPVLNGSTHGEAREQTPGQDFLKSMNEMKHFFSKTNIEEIIDLERPSISETLHSFEGGPSAVPHHLTSDIHSYKSEEEVDDEASATYRQSDLTIFPRTES